VFNFKAFANYYIKDVKKAIPFRLSPEGGQSQIFFRRADPPDRGIASLLKKFTLEAKINADKKNLIIKIFICFEKTNQMIFFVPKGLTPPLNEMRRGVID